MSTEYARSRLPAATLSLAVLLLAASPPSPAQTAWDQQDQAYMFRQLAAQGLLRAPDSGRADEARRYSRDCRTCSQADRRDTQPDPARLREAGRDNGAGADPLRAFGHETGPRTLPTVDGAVLAEDGMTKIAVPPTSREGRGLEL